MILYGTDLHISFIEQNSIENFEGKVKQLFIIPLLKKYKKEKLEDSILILAGDISEKPNLTRDFLDVLIKELPLKKIIITFGNHDLRITKFDQLNYGDLYKDSYQKYKYLCNFFHNYGNGKVHVIDKEGYYHGKSLIIGNMQWFNPLYKNNLTNEKLEKLKLFNFSEKNIEKGSFLYFGTNDRLYLKGINDDKFSNKLINNLLKQFEKISNENADYEEIIAISHFCPNFKIEKGKQYQFNENLLKIINEENKQNYKSEIDLIFSNLFYSNVQIQELYEKIGVNKAVYGHTHEEIKGKIYNGIKFYNNPFGYYNYYKGSSFNFIELK